jgi:hypothetical protein
MEGASLSVLVEELSKEAQEVLGGGRKSEGANRRWLETNLPKGLSPETVRQAIQGLRLAMDAGAVWGIEPGDTASLAALDRMTDKGSRKVLAVALEYAREAETGVEPEAEGRQAIGLKEILAGLGEGRSEPVDISERVEEQKRKLAEVDEEGVA